MSDWFARQLQARQGQESPPRGLVVQHRPAPVQQPPAAPQQAPAAPQQYQQPPAPQEPSWKGKSYRQVAHELDPENGRVLHLAPANGDAAKMGELNNTCPNCGSLNVFSRNNAQGTFNENTGMSVKPHARCYECGWTQSNFIPGDESNWVAT